MSYQRFKKGGRVAKSPFLAKSVQKSLNKKNKKMTFFQKTTFFESPIAQKRFIFEHSYIANVNQVDISFYLSAFSHNFLI